MCLKPPRSTSCNFKGRRYLKFKEVEKSGSENNVGGGNFALQICAPLISMSNHEFALRPKKIVFWFAEIGENLKFKMSSEIHQTHFLPKGF